MTTYEIYDIASQEPNTLFGVIERKKKVKENAGIRKASETFKKLRSKRKKK